MSTGQELAARIRGGHPYGWLAILFLTGGILGTLLADVPAKLPGAALGSELVLHVERAAAIVAGLLLAAVVVARAFAGQLPDELSGRGLKYAAAASVEEASDALTHSIRRLEDAARALDRRVTAIEQDRRDDAEVVTAIVDSLDALVGDVDVLAATVDELRDPRQREQDPGTDVQ